MGNTALKLEYADTEKLSAFRRVFFTPPAAPAFLLESEDIEKLDFHMPEVPEFPFSFFMDIHGHVHFEMKSLELLYS